MNSSIQSSLVVVGKTHDVEAGGLGPRGGVFFDRVFHFGVVVEVRILALAFQDDLASHQSR
jgi:hypothetical protein